MLIVDLMQVASRVAELGTQQNAEDEVLAEAPEEFYDPILSTLMTDPVILPSSKTTCDRSTIARFVYLKNLLPFLKLCRKSYIFFVSNIDELFSMYYQRLFDKMCI